METGAAVARGASVTKLVVSMVARGGFEAGSRIEIPLLPGFLLFFATTLTGASLGTSSDSTSASSASAFSSSLEEATGGDSAFLALLVVFFFPFGAALVPAP